MNQLGLAATNKRLKRAKAQNEKLEEKKVLTIQNPTRKVAESREANGLS